VGACHRGVGEWDVTTETAKQETTESVRFLLLWFLFFGTGPRSRKNRKRHITTTTADYHHTVKMHSRPGREYGAA